MHFTYSNNTFTYSNNAREKGGKNELILGGRFAKLYYIIYIIYIILYIIIKPVSTGY